MKAMPQPVRLLVDYGPLLAFFVAYKAAGLASATLALIVATIAAFAAGLFYTRKVPLMPLVTLIVVGAFGGLTLAFDDPVFIKMKPTILQALFALVLLGGHLLGRPVLPAILGEALRLTPAGWRQLGLRLAAFFAAMAALNEIAWRNLSEALWVDFKVFGLTGLTFLFMLAQIPLIRRHAEGD